MKVYNIRLQYPEESNKMEVVLTIDRSTSNIKEVQATRDLLGKEKDIEATLKEKKKRRSLDANAMLWNIMNEIAIILNTTKDEVYLEMLDRYGVFTHIVVKPDIVEKVKKEWRIVRELGSVVVNGTVGVQLQCYFGSSSYNSKEFSVLLEGTIYEAKELGIEVISERERQLLINKWGVKYEQK